MHPQITQITQILAACWPQRGKTRRRLFLLTRSREAAKKTKAPAK